MQAEAVLEMLPSIQYALLCYTYGKLDKFISFGNTEAHEDYIETYYDAIGSAADLFELHYSEKTEEHCLYVSFQSMVEYYRLCRQYSRVHRIRLRENPYMKDAEDYVHCAMDLDGNGGYYVHLQTKINHKWASGLVIYIDEGNFNSEFELAEAVFEIGDYYERAVVRLRQTLLKEYAFWLPALPEHRKEEKCESVKGTGSSD